MIRSVLILSANEDISVPLWHALERAGLRAEVLPIDLTVLQRVGERLSQQPDRCWAAIVDASGRQGIVLIRRLRDTFPELFLLAAVASPSVATTQAVTEAGARDYLVHPFDEEQIAACLRLWGESPTSPASGRMVCFLPARAGDGASTVALHVADAAVHERKARGFHGRVLLVDLDFQSGDIAFRLQLSPRGTLADALQATPIANSPAQNSAATNSATTNSLTTNSPAASSAGSGSPGSDRMGPQWRDWVCPWRQVDVLAAPPPAAAIANSQPAAAAAVLAAAKARYPFVVCDMPPAIYSSSPAVLRLADEVCVVCTPEITSLHLAKRRVEELQQAGVERSNLRLVLNRTGSHPWIGSQEVEQAVALPLSARLANDYAGLHAAILQGSVVKRRSTLGKQIGELTRQALGVQTQAAAA
jgi:Flp pilus assembly CpaE family ATPase